MQETKITALVEPVLAEQGLELDELKITPMGRRKVLRITVDGDGQDGRGPLLDDISRASRELSIALDGSEAVGEQPYTLEVTSRGVSTPLTQPKHYRRNTGRLVALNLAEEQVTGRIIAVDDTAVTLEVDGQEKDYSLNQITKAVVQVEMSRKTKEN